MDSIDCLNVISDRLVVSRETREALSHYVDLVRKWQPVQNLISPKTLDQIWMRHVLDSVQLMLIRPEARHWLDLGSGAGFPGLVIAILLKEKGEGTVTMIESNGRKAAFLRTVARETGCSAQVINGRIESVIADYQKPVDVVSARALASLGQLCRFIHPLMNDKTVALFHKGREFESEINDATDQWSFNLIKHKSVVDDESVILELQTLSPAVEL